MKLASSSLFSIRFEPCQVCFFFFLERNIQVQSFSIQSLYPWTKLTRRNERHLIIKLCTCIITLFFFFFAGLPLSWQEIRGKWNRGGQGGREGPLTGSRDSVPVGVRGRRPLRKIGVSGHIEAKYGLFWHGMQVSVSYRLSPHKYTNYPSMSLKLDYWSCNPLAFDREINVLLCKDASPREMAGHSGSQRANKWSRSSNIFDKEQVSHILRLVLRSWGVGA